jgi:16S rRNA (adenine1518-N6/adenine1519-N6)-dimethyltransferase
VIAPPGDRARGSLSAYCEARADRRVALKVPPGAFVPAPKVHSAVLRLDLFAAPRTEGLSPTLVERVTRVAFAQPRKTVRRCLADALDPALADAALAAAGVPPGARPSDLELSQINALSRALEALGAAGALGLAAAAAEPAGG